MKTKLKLLICSLLLMCGLSFAQQTGTTDFGAADSFAVDSIDLTTLTPSINVPVNSKKGAIPFAYSIRLSTYCQVIGQNTGQTTTCYPPTQLGTLGSLIGSSVAYYTTIPLGGNCYQFQDFYITDSSGTVHNLPHADALDNCASNNFTDAAYDSSGLTLNASVTTNGNGGAVFTYSLLDANGHYTEQETGGGIVFLSETDAFGNQIKGVGSSYIDTLNTSALTFVSNGYQWLDASGTGQTLTVTKGTGLSINKGSNFNCYSNPNTGTSYPLTFGYPDGTSIGIGLEQGAGGTGTTTGRIGSVTLRTGATISYSYGAFYLCPSYNADGPVYPSSLTRTTPDGTTTYTITSVNTTTKITPDGNKTVYTYQAAQAAVVGPPYVTPAYPAALLQVQFYQNTGSVSSPVYVITKTVTYCYNGNQTNCSTSGVSYPIVQRDVYTELWNTAGTSGVTSRQTLMFDANESVTSASNYDFGASSWTTQTNITYGSWNGSSCTAVGSSILTLPCDVVTTDGTHTLAETRKTYNSSGGLLSSSTWTGSTWLTDTYTVNSNGTLASSTAANGLYATYSQSGGCNGLFNTSTNATVSSGDILTSSIGWNCDIGAVTSLTDNNGNSISATSFDSMLRPLSSTDESGLTSTSSYTANSKSITTAFSTYSSTSTASVDSLGRAVLSQTTNGNSYDTLSASHRFVGINFVEGSAVPCAQSTLGAGCTITANAYKDVLGRTVKYTDGNGKLVTTVYSLNDVQTTAGPAPTGEHTKTVQTEYDGLGRVKSVCALQTSGGSSCGQAMGGSGILTTYTYTFGAGTTTVTATRGSETKSSTMDAKGRTVSSTTPEAGTSTYTYDSTTSGPCGAVTSLGDLISVNVSGSYTRCYSYDKMHRTTDVTPSRCRAG